MKATSKTYQVEFKDMKVGELRKLLRMNEADQLDYVCENLITKVTKNGSVVNVDNLPSSEFGEVLSLVKQGAFPKA